MNARGEPWHRDGKNVTVGESATEGRRSKPSTMRAARPPASLLEEDSVMWENGNIGLKCVFHEQDGKVVAVGVVVEFVRDMWCVIAGFPKGSPHGSGRRLRKGGFSAWVPVEQREILLVVHEVTDGVGGRGRQRWAWVHPNVS